MEAKFAKLHVFWKRALLRSGRGRFSTRCNRVPNRDQLM